MRIGIYHEVRGPKAGGAEAVTTAIAEALASEQTVEILHAHPSTSLADWEAAFGANLAGVTLRRLESPSAETGWSQPWQRWRAERDRGRTLTAEYDLVIGSIHAPPPMNLAQSGALYVHFPIFNRARTFPYTQDDAGGFRRWLRRRYAGWEWERRFGGYQVLMANSEFTQRHIRDWWGQESTVVHPPISPPPPLRPKVPRILSVGRFADSSSSKRQLEMMRAFSRLDEAGGSWEYVTAGGVEDVPRHQAYVEAVRAAAGSSRAIVETNLTRARLDELYATSSIFWHATGLGVPADTPQYMEHFGIVTAEAMAAGCVPVVLARGGQPEIVTHGVTGFLWETEEELLRHTRTLVTDPVLCARMSAAARESGQRFRKEAFQTRLRACLAPLLHAQ